MDRLHWFLSRSLMSLSTAWRSVIIGCRRTTAIAGQAGVVRRVFQNLWLYPAVLLGCSVATVSISLFGRAFDRSLYPFASVRTFFE